LLANRERDAEAIAGVQDRFRRDPELAALLRGGLERVGVDAVRTYWDPPYLRVVPPADPGAERQIGRIGLHRDTWSSNIPQQSNWWTTVYPLAADRTIAFLSGYWSRPLSNTSADWSVPNTSERARVSVELPTVNRDDLDAGRGAPRSTDGRHAYRSTGSDRWPTERPCPRSPLGDAPSPMILATVSMSPAMVVPASPR
jgi:hypothetical protein